MPQMRLVIRWGVARVFALHEHAVAAKDRRRRMALGHPPGREVDLRINPQAADDPRDRVPRHLDQLWLFRPGRCLADGSSPLSGSRLGILGHSRPTVHFRLVPRQSGSRFSDCRVKLRSARTVLPYITTAVVDSCAPGGSSRNGMNLSESPASCSRCTLRPRSDSRRSRSSNPACRRCTAPPAPNTPA